MGIGNAHQSGGSYHQVTQISRHSLSANRQSVPSYLLPSAVVIMILIGLSKSPSAGFSREGLILLGTFVPSEFSN
jgi:hypothetical protein